MSENQPQPNQPQQRKPDRYEKEEEKRPEKEEKNRNEKNWDEKWRRDPVNAACWAAIFIWAGLCLIAETTHWGPNTFSWWKTWAVILSGAGAILIIGALARLAMPEHRRPIIGNLIVGLILLGVGLGDVTNWGWGTIGATILILVGLAIVLAGIFRKRR